MGGSTSPAILMYVIPVGTRAAQEDGASRDAIPIFSPLIVLMPHICNCTR